MRQLAAAADLDAGRLSNIPFAFSNITEEESGFCSLINIETGEYIPERERTIVSDSPSFGEKGSECIEKKVNFDP